MTPPCRVMHSARPLIRAVVFDLGGTLEDIYYDDRIRQQAIQGLRRLLRERGLDPGLDLPALCETVERGLAAYQNWRERTNLELPAERVWTEFVFPDGVGQRLPRDKVIAVAEDLAFFYENNAYVRRLRPEAPAALAALRDRGLRLAVVSNIISRRLVPANLQAYGVAHFFEHVIISSAMGVRKPHPRIFLEAARRLGVPPRTCAYVGDTISRDVIGARRAGYGLAIQIRSFLTDRVDRGVPVVQPDAVVHDLRDVVPLVTGPAISEHPSADS